MAMSHPPPVGYAKLVASSVYTSILMFHVEQSGVEHMGITMPKEFYFTPHQALTYNCLFNHFVGARGQGKTYGSTTYCINQFIKKGSQMVYVRRYKSELKKFGNFFNAVRAEFPGRELQVDGWTGFVDGEPFVQAMPLSTAKVDKGVPFPDVDYIVFDEYLLDKGLHHYLPDEVTQFLELYETVARTRDVRVLFLSNAISQTNPYFLQFKLRMPKAGCIWRHNEQLVQNVANADFIELKKQTRFGQIIEGTAYERYAVHNEFLRDSFTFVEKKSGNPRFKFIFEYDGQTYGVWEASDFSKVWVSKDIDPSCPIRYSLTQDDHTPNTRLIKRASQAGLFKTFIDDYKSGYARFESIDIKNVVEDIIQKTF